MTAPATLQAPQARVEVAGVTLAADVSRRVLSVRYDDNLDLADMFTVTLDNADGRLTDSALFDLGKRVEIRMGYGDDLRPMMLGEIASIAPSFPQSGAPTLTVSGYDRSHRLRHDVIDRPAFKGMTDSAIAAQIALEAGLIPVVDPSPFFHQELLHPGTDMALLKERAAANHFEVYVRWDRLFFRLPRPQTGAFVLEWGRNLTGFSPRLSSAGTAAVQVVRGYDQDLAQTIVGMAVAVDLRAEDLVERLGSSALDALVQLGRRAVRRDRPVKSQLDARSLATAVLQQLMDGLYEADGGCQGNPDLRADDIIVVRGVGRRFSGHYRLRRVTHTVDAAGYRTDFEAGQRASTSMLSLLRGSITDDPPPDGPERFRGVVLGKVVAVDPARYKVKVGFPWLSDSAESPWASCVTPLAGDNHGLFALPHEGDQVVVAFEQGSVGDPVVLGSVFDQKGTKPVTAAPGAKNTMRRLRTRAGHMITLDDTEKGEQVEITDKAGSTVTLRPDGTVRVQAAKDIELNAPGGEIRMNARYVKVKVSGMADSHMDVSG